MAAARSMLLNREGWKVEKKLAYSLYGEEGLTLRHKQRSVESQCTAAMHVANSLYS